MKMQWRYLPLFLFITLFSPFSQAREGDCVYALGNEMYAHCSFISAPDNTKRFLEVVYNGKMTITSCVDNTILPFTFSKDMIGTNKHNLVQPGQHTALFYECTSIDCAKKKLIGTDKFTVAEDKSVTPDKFNIPLDTSFGDSCNSVNLNPLNMLIILPYEKCKEFPYCVSMDDAKTVNKYVKVISDQKVAFTYCTNQDFGFALTPDASAGQHTFEFYQCDTLECNQQKLLSKDTLTVIPQKFEHATFTITLDPDFGDNCKMQ